jgi:hypothetical protein
VVLFSEDLENWNGVLSIMEIRVNTVDQAEFMHEKIKKMNIKCIKHSYYYEELSSVSGILVSIFYVFMFQGGG